jgi:uncharacterized lipoprotein YbaY
MRPFFRPVNNQPGSFNLKFEPSSLSDAHRMERLQAVRFFVHAGH